MFAELVFAGPRYDRLARVDRMVRIGLPLSYNRNPGRSYPVLYIHDGQNAFTSAGHDVAFGWGNWELDRIAVALAREQRMEEIILVAIDCTEDRYYDYRGPARPRGVDAGRRLAPSSRARAADMRFRRYVQFLVDDLKPWVDQTYRTRTEPAHTGLLGSSMGGLASLAIAWDRPDVFGLAASLSGAFQVEQRWFLRGVLGACHGARNPLRIYLDSGAIDYGGGDDGRRDTAAVAKALRRLGWCDGLDLLHYVDEFPMDDAALEKAGLRRDKWNEARTNQHNEFYWRQRVWRALTFLFPPQR